MIFSKKTILNFPRSHLLSIILILFIVFFTWSGVLEQTMTGEAPLYFYYPFLTQYFKWGELLVNDKGARIYYDIVEIFFRDNFFLYQIALLAIVLISAVLFYFFVFSFTKTKLISFIATLFYSINFSGSFEMIAIGRQDMFVERMINVLIVFPSFICYGFFRKTGKWKYYFCSVLLFLFSTFFAHFSIFFLPFLASLIIIESLEKKSKREKIERILLLLPYVLGSGLMIYADSLRGFTHVGRDTFPKSLSSILPILTNILHQITISTIPVPFLLEKYSFLSMKTYEISRFYLPVLLLYSATLLFILRYSKKSLKIVALASLLAVILVCLLNLYMRWSIVTRLSPSSRYLFAISIPLSVYWSIVIFCLFYRNTLSKVFFWIIIAVWAVVNILTIKHEVSLGMWRHKAIKAIDIYVKQISPKLHDDSIVIVADVLGYHGANKLRYFYGKNSMTFLPIFGLVPYPLKREFQPGKDYLILYDYETQKAVDESKEHKKFIKLSSK